MIPRFFVVVFTYALSMPALYMTLVAAVEELRSPSSSFALAAVWVAAWAIHLAMSSTWVFDIHLTKAWPTAGNDCYVVDNASDLVIEEVNAGMDTVQASVSYTLGANLENLKLAGSAAIDGRGNTLANMLTGNAAANFLHGGDGNDVLDGQAGKDMVVGGAGNDTFLMGRGYGVDTVLGYDTTAGKTDVLQFQAGIIASQLWFRQAGGNLEVSIIGTGDKAIVENWYMGNAYHVEQIKAGDGKLLLDTQVQNLVQAMAAFAPPPMGQTTLTVAQQTALAPVLAASWH